MIVSHSRRFVFVHVHKTAGESVTRALAPHLGRGDVVLGGTRRGNLANIYWRRRHGLAKHSAARDIRAFLGEEAWAAYFTFSIVRNPYDRALSFYRYLQRMLARRREEGLERLLHRLPGFEVRDPLRWPEMAALIETESFSDYIRHPAVGPDRHGTRPQVAVLGDGAGRLIVDAVGRFETLEADFAGIARRLGIAGATLGRHNVSAGAAAAGPARLSPADRDHLYAVYRDDFEAFGYARTEAA